MLTEFSLIAFFVLMVTGFAVLLIILPVVLRKSGIVPHKPSQVKSQSYECGLETVGPTWVQFKISYYFYTLLLITLDISSVFIYPWAVDLRAMDPGALLPIFSFIGILAIGFIYAWRKGALEWK